MTLAGYLRGRFPAPDGDEKFTSILGGLSCDREVFIKYYKAIHTAVTARAKGPTAGGFMDNVYASYISAAESAPDLNLYQFTFAATVFNELKILNTVNGRLSVNSKISTELFTSSAYNTVRGLNIGAALESVPNCELKVTN
jgi:hypothetical protein